MNGCQTLCYEESLKHCGLIILQSTERDSKTDNILRRTHPCAALNTSFQMSKGKNTQSDYYQLKGGMVAYYDVNRTSATKKLISIF